MGVEPLEPGWDVFRVRPQIGSLEWAVVNVPTIKGAAEVACLQDHSTYTLELTVPGNTTADVELPYAGKKRPGITINGESMTIKTTDGLLKFPRLAGGSYRITVDLR